MSAIGAYGSYGSLSGYYSLLQNRNSNPVSTEAVSPVSRAETTPVQPVSRVDSVHRGSTQAVQEDRQDSRFQFPTMREGADPAEMAVRSRIQYLSDKAENLEQELLGRNQSNGIEELLKGEEETQPEKVKMPWEDPQQEALKASQEKDETKSAQEVVEESECQTCKNRKYQDGSDDPGVSFKTAATVAPEQAASAVRGHEQEHVVREQAKAQREDRKVVSQSVTIHTEICPECGDVYVSGGTTRTTTKANPVEEPSQADNEKRSGFEAFA